ncbi:MAG TPA: amidohydrolase [Pirellulaceae bacterium]|nr:amidohydrolase [Pirellulaceae bacterium]
MLRDCLVSALTLAISASLVAAEPPDLILHHGKIATVDKGFSIGQAIAIRGERIVQVGTNDEVLAAKGDATKLIDLGGKLVLPGLIDSHTHPVGAALHEFDHPIPEMETIDDVLKYIASRAAALPEGEWITVRQVFITRLKEQRYPTRAELDAAAPKHPVMFSTGPDGMLNSLALKVSGIDKDFQVAGNGQVEKDPQTGEPTGMLRSCTRYAKVKSSAKSASGEQRRTRLEELFRDYNSVGITSIADRDASSGNVELYEQLLADDGLSVRVMISQSLDVGGRIEAVRERLGAIAAHPLRAENPRLRIVGIKTYLDGGMLTGSAYMREPWGVSKIYSIRDPDYRGNLFIEPEKLKDVVQATVESGLQFTAHSVGDGAVHNLIDAYEAVSKSMPIRETRPCITHCNFMSREAVERMAKLGIVADIQPAWLYLDTRTLTAQFGYDRLRYFQPLKTCFELGVPVGGGSDHMQKIGSFRSVNPYNPFLGMATAITRRAKGYDGQLHPEEALSREQAIRFYTANNAYILFLDKLVGSLEAGKQADLIVVDRDLLTCPEDQIRDTRVLQTYLAGKLVHEAR